MDYSCPTRWTPTAITISCWFSSQRFRWRRLCSRVSADWRTGRSAGGQRRVGLAAGAAGAGQSWQALIPLYSQDYRGRAGLLAEIASQLPTGREDHRPDPGLRLPVDVLRLAQGDPLAQPRRDQAEHPARQREGVHRFFAKRTEGKSYFLITAFKQFEDQPVLQQNARPRIISLLAEGPGYLIYDLAERP